MKERKILLISKNMYGFYPCSCNQISNICYLKKNLSEVAGQKNLLSN